jgi:hypothetical protein
MTDKDAFAERERALEDDYFRRKDRELIEKMRRRGEIEQAVKGLAEATGVSDEELLQDLYERGFTAETARLLHLVPLVEIAWAEGGVVAREREMILEIARARGIKAGTEAYRHLEQWLTVRPKQGLFESALRVLRAMFASLPPEDQAKSRQSLLDYCRTIAALSGGILGIGRVSNEEHALLDRIAREFEESRPDAARRVVGE